VSVATTPSVDAVRALVDGADLVVDALLGTGLRSAPRAPDDAAIRALEGRRVLSIDVPSGLDATSGVVFDPCVRAEVTCTLTAAKAAFWSRTTRTWTGRIVVADIGMPRTAWRAAGLVPPTAIRGGCLLRLPTDEP
jgi:NAD(P)H-hydrate repair Nnr-like enzyme with NAD(P)H-hydrate epimerase domain